MMSASLKQVLNMCVYWYREVFSAIFEIFSVSTLYQTKVTLIVSFYKKVLG